MYVYLYYFTHHEYYLKGTNWNFFSQVSMIGCLFSSQKFFMGF